jgi:hypothetical protein
LPRVEEFLRTVTVSFDVDEILVADEVAKNVPDAEGICGEFDNTDVLLFDVGAVMEAAEDEEYCTGAEVDGLRCVVEVSPDIEAVERAVEEF